MTVRTLIDESELGPPDPFETPAARGYLAEIERVVLERARCPCRICSRVSLGDLKRALGDKLNDKEFNILDITERSLLITQRIFSGRIEFEPVGFRLRRRTVSWNQRLGLHTDRQPLKGE